MVRSVVEWDSCLCVCERGRLHGRLHNSCCSLTCCEKDAKCLWVFMSLRWHEPSTCFLLIRTLEISFKMFMRQKKFRRKSFFFPFVCVVVYIFLYVYLWWSLAKLTNMICGRFRQPKKKNSEENTNLSTELHFKWPTPLLLSKHCLNSLFDLAQLPSGPNHLFYRDEQFNL